MLGNARFSWLGVTSSWSGCRFRRNCSEGRSLGAAVGPLNPWEERNLAEAGDIVSGVSGRYASALFALAHERRETVAVGEALARFDGMIAESPDLQRLVRSPVFSADEQGKALGALLEAAGISGISANFLRLVAAKRRLFAIREMIADYGKLNDRFRGVTRAQVTSAAPLSDENVAALKESLRAISGGKDVDLTVKLDPSLIGGLIAQLGSRMVDGSLKTKLNAIRTRMKEVG
jgi:F-type H+-transporting ATPase subunit delta